MAKILLVEDDGTIRDIVVAVLQRDAHEVDTCDNGASGKDRLAETTYDLAIFDWQLPKLTGVELCAHARTSGITMPILMLTSRSASSDIQSGLDAGADDYLVKPFTPGELVARVKALLRRPKKLSANALKCGALVMDLASTKVTLGGAPLELTDQEYAVLEFLLRHQGEVYSAEQLLDHVWSSDSDAAFGAVASCMKRLRKKLAPDGSDSLIKTSYGKGYKLEP